MEPNRRQFCQTLDDGVIGLNLGNSFLSWASCASPLQRNDKDGQVLFIGAGIHETQVGTRHMGFSSCCIISCNPEIMKNNQISKTMY